MLKWGGTQNVTFFVATTASKQVPKWYEDMLFDRFDSTGTSILLCFKKVNSEKHYIGLMCYH